MASLSFVSSPFLFLFLSVVLLISPAHSLNCTSQKFTNNKVFDNCTDLPTLDAYLHYTYNSSNSSLSIAFKAPPAETDGWVGWGVNLNGTGMAGAQALVALKNGTVVVVKKYNLASYTDIEETSKLTVDVWDLSAESDSTGNFVIFASVKVPAGPSVNQIWQVGPSVKDGFPEKHGFASANLQAMGKLELVASKSSGGKTTGGTGTNSTSSSSEGSSSGYKIKELNVGFQFGVLALLGILMVF
ncbi:auxin-induced in root cultures protein 12 [Manihot esculenta]|uniref:DOMON domain-containing protein n=1 Tax=Manihot esculenta TaxID=3983 RepID=A0A2C9UP66_MANES|nr:auxin-induced in root cultures protein 12 [Manihot esculenta]